MSPENPDPEIKVTDRRRFSSEGDPLSPSEPEDPEGAETPSIEDRAIPPLPPPSFEFLISSMRWQAELQLGLYQPPEGEPHRDLEGARHTIDLMSVLQEKTRGNLTLEEQRLLENSLTELRFRYVQAAEQTCRKP